MNNHIIDSLTLNNKDKDDIKSKISQNEILSNSINKNSERNNSINNSKQNDNFDNIKNEVQIKINDDISLISEANKAI